MMIAALAIAIGITTAILPTQRVYAYPAYVYNGATGAPRIGVIGDSTLSGVRWNGLADPYEPLKSLNFRFDAESCRRTLSPSCRGRGGIAPTTALQELRSAPGQWGELLVMVGGYNDAGRTFGSAVDAIMAEAERQGISRVMWLTLRTAPVEYPRPGFQSSTFSFTDNNRILLRKADQYGGRLQVADWATYTRWRSDWFAADGLHYRTGAGIGVLEFIASLAPRVIAGEQITPAMFCDDKPVTMLGGPFADTITGTSGDDVISGNSGADRIHGGGGNDTICGGSGDDAIEGGPGRDTIYGGSGNDTLTG